VEDRSDLRLLFVHPGTVWKYPRAPDGRWLKLPEPRWVLADRTWDPPRAILSFALPGRSYAPMLFWDRDWEPLHWYVNLESPLRRTPVGFDYTDHVLDVLLPPDRSSWSWKDEDELDQALRRGLFSPRQAQGFRRDGEEAVRLLKDRLVPFDHDWRDWRPPPEWAAPELPADWDRVD
jgi:hypothetical protein